MLRLAGELAAVAVDGRRCSSRAAARRTPSCLHRARDAGLGGFEFACAIPGTAGGGVWMNAGAYGGDFAQVLERALVVDADGARLADAGRARARVPALGARGTARSSRAVELRLAPRPAEEIKATVAELQAQRKAAQPTNKRTFGSVFKNPRARARRRAGCSRPAA